MSDEIEDPAASAAQPTEAPLDDDLLNDQADAAEDFLNGLLDVLDLDGEATAEIEGDAVVVELEGPNMGLLIGRHGSTLEALQDLTRAAVLRATSRYALLTLDIEGYQDRHREILTRKARSAASQALSTGEPVALEPMTAADRKIIHTALAEAGDVVTASEGDEPNRYIVIRPR